MADIRADAQSQRLIVIHSILIGATPLIPIPLVDDLAKTHLQRRAVRKLAGLRGLRLDERDVRVLADDAGEGCLWGCLVTVTLGLVKRLFRKVFFFLEWKRTVDLVSRSYHHAYLLNLAFTNSWCAPAGPRTSAELRAAVDDVCRTAPIKPVEHAVTATFSQSKSVLKNAARLMQRSFRRLTGKPTGEQVEEAIEAIEEQEEREIEGLAGKLQRAVSAIPEEHFRRLREELAERLGFQSN